MNLYLYIRIYFKNIQICKVATVEPKKLFLFNWDKLWTSFWITLCNIKLVFIAALFENIVSYHICLHQQIKLVVGD